MKRFAFLLVTLLSAASCNDDITGLGPPSDPAKETFAASLGVDISSMSKTTSGVYYKDIVVGSSTAPEVTGKTDTVRVTYAGYLKDGTLFDSRANTLLAPSSLIAGFRDGMVGMREGGKRKIVIPSALGYGGRSQKNPLTGRITIPRQATLVFDIELLKVYNPVPAPV